VQAAWLERVVTRAVTTHALHCGVPAVEQWAMRWLSGENRTARAAEEAWWAAWGGGAEEAARGAREAARAAEYGLQVADLLAVLDAAEGA